MWNDRFSTVSAFLHTRGRKQTFINHPSPSHPASIRRTTPLPPPAPTPPADNLTIQTPPSARPHSLEPPP